MGKNRLNSERRFVTFFPQFIPEGFTKDVGMIPTVLIKEYGYNAKLVCNIPEKFYRPDQNIFNLPIDYIANSKFSQFSYIWKHAKEIDVLNMYHMSLDKCFLLRLYKFRNPKGISYLKLDLDKRALENHRRLKPWKKKILAVLQRKIDIITAESEQIAREYETLFGHKVWYLPNGFWEYHIYNPYENGKRDVFLTVGRLGKEQKATDILLEAFALSCDKHSWNLRLVGPVADDFTEYIDEYFKKYPELRHRISFVGNISDKIQLEKEYEESKVFVLPSRWESFGLVLAEAISKGCYIVTTDAVPIASEVTSQFLYGSCCKTDDVFDLAEHMQKAIQEVNTEGLEKEIKDFSTCFSWKRILCRLDELIQEKK